ncbi:MAG: hypothetical protein E7167_02380 [Firmicutes bacterium]|nr:hypothetical protein [Bacillota bacterium]
MNNKYAYATAITNDNYIPCIILNKRIMDYLKCKYPFIVLIAGEVTEQGIKQMKDFGIIV